MSIGTAIGAIALHLAEAEPISRSKPLDVSNSMTRVAADGRSRLLIQAAPRMAMIGPRFDQENIAMKCAAKNATTR